MGNSTSKANVKNTSYNRDSFNINAAEQAQSETEQSLAALALIKERRRLELLAFEEEQAKRLEEEAQLKNSFKLNQNKFLNHITESQKELENKLLGVRQQQEASRQRFSEQLCQTEAEMEANITDVLISVKAHKDQRQLQELVKAEEKQSQALLALKLEEFKNLRKDDILSAMKSQLELDLTKKNPNNLNKKIFHVQLEDEAKNRQIEKILQHRQKDQANLVMSLLEEESWQYQAFSSLLSHRDRRIALLSQDIQAVVDQLNQLTSWELQRKNRQVDNANNALETNRLQLAEVLSQLLEQQQLRRKDLKQLLEEMEVQRKNQAADYWLVQYQRLMDNMPESIPNAQQYLPSAPSNIEEVLVGQASAPPLDSVFMETNCVVCFDSTCQVIFLTCGHLCCCTKCGESLHQCPMCRATIIQRLQVHYS